MIKNIFLFFCLFSVSLFADEIEQELKKLMKKSDIPGMSVVVIKGGKSRFYHLGVADKKTKRPIDENTIFELASITKVFTSTAIAAEVLQGKMDLNKPIDRYLSFAEMNRSEKEGIKDVTLAHLLTHTASLPRVAPTNKGQRHTSRSLLNYLASWKPKEKIGSNYLYSNLGFGIAGQALEYVERKPLINIFNTTILSPLNMRNTVMERVEPLIRKYATGYSQKGMPVKAASLGPLAGSGALKSSSGDMEKFLRANMGLKTPPQLWEAMQLAQKPRFKVRPGFSLGLGWQVSTLNSRLLIDKNGGLAGFSTYIGFYPEEGVGIVILANKTKIQATEVGRRLLKQLLTPR